MTPTPDPSKSFQEQDPCILLACLIFGEGRSLAMPGKLAIGCVVRNRVYKQPEFGIGWTGVMLKPYQFSCFNPNDPNRALLLEPLKHDSQLCWDQAFCAAYIVLNGSVPDTTKGALYYFGPPLKVNPSAWGEVEHCCTMGTLSFWRPSEETVTA